MTDTTPRYITCRRCKGAGWIDAVAHVDMGKCFNCQGAGQVRVYTAAEKAAMKARADAFIACANVLGPAIRSLPYRQSHAADYARIMLERDEPARYDRLVASVNAGRLDAVIAALIVHYTHLTGEAV